ncbi:WD40 repeat-like protein [Coniochaeta ligniaria NRRL 30616]|uniref:WD40 repeat-like protein n=1 Tax=Coniochaeta ligniaria NRRL 30616 TaxID=1408157 RepID=A0A1J7J5P0_9PEZI|nr:WD40 repeat-like protein [Coniochaeta ligniaria NRRL 30616]
MAPILSVFRAGADRRHHHQQAQEHSEGDLRDVTTPDTTSTSLPSSDGREPFPTLPRDSPRSRLSRYPTNSGRPGTDNSSAPSPRLARRTSSRFSTNTTPSGDALSPLYSDLFPKQATPTGDAGSFKKRGFLGRLSMPGMPGRGKKKDNDDTLDSDSELGTDGASARVFSQAIAAPGAGGGYMPQHKEPPRYIRTKVANKKVREFGQMFLAQELVGTRPPGSQAGENGTAVPPDATHEGTNGGKSSVSVASSSAKGSTIRGQRQTGGAIWATEFSKDGKYLAAGGRDQVVRVWAVISTAEERKAQEEEELSNGGSGERLSAPVFMEKPFREFRGHTGEILDLSWSKNNFLLSSSMDKTVRLWHISRTDCLCTFKHKDFVTKLAFHPRDDRFFLAGSLDTMLRLWSIPDKAIAYSAQLPDLVTAVAFSPDGKTAIAGVLSGLCLFFDTEGLKFQTQIHVRSSRGKNAKGSKITGITTMTVSPRFPSTQRTGTLPHRTSSDLAGDVKILITSNDSRIRIYNMRDKALEHKLKGHENVCSQIAASFSDDGKYIICGSEDRKAFIWNVAAAGAELNTDKKPYEYFAAHPDIVTTAIFAPTKTRILLNGGGDPIFELCNPPPVTLRSLEEVASATNSQVALSTADMAAGGESTTTLNGGAGVAPPPRRPEESPAYIARSTHYDGNIIVTTDDTGIIKVFRQDCAAAKRKHDNWESASSTFGRKQSQSLGGGFSIGGPGLGRSASIVTRTSVGSAAHSRRGSLSQLGPNSAITSPQLGGFNAGHSERILSWRQGIERNGVNRPVSSILTTARASERSLSPSKSRTALGSASEARKQPYANSGRPGGGTIRSPTSSTYGSTADDKGSLRMSRELLRQKSRNEEKDGPSEPPTPSFSFVTADAEDDNLQLDPAGASYSFWNLNRWRNMATRNSSGQSSGLRAISDHSNSPQSRSRVRSPDKEAAASPLGGPSEEKANASEKEAKARRKSLGTPGSLTAAASDPPVDGSSRPRPASAYFALAPTSTGVQSIPSIRLPDDDPTGQGDSGSELSPYGEGIYSRGNSIASKLTSELNFERDHVLEAEEGEEDEMRCRKCGGREFKAKRVAGKQSLSCGRCGETVDE